jgi:phage FluMu protein Com
MKQMERTPVSNAVTSKTTSALSEYRCKCGKLLFKGLLLSGILELKCKRCHDIKKFTFYNVSKDIDALGN